jgi:lincosamide nucleotidyltransferase A/C/D/E
VGALLHTRRVERTRKRFFAISVESVVAVLDALQAAGVGAWLAGGWGVDALVGRETRWHSDVDVLVDVADEGLARAVQALTGLGYVDSGTDGDAGALLPVRVVVRDVAGRTIDLLGIKQGDDVGGVDNAPSFSRDDLDRGRLAGRVVPCVSGRAQLYLHQSYEPTETDRRDVELLCQELNLPLPNGYRRS